MNQPRQFTFPLIIIAGALIVSVAACDTKLTQAERRKLEATGEPVLTGARIPPKDPHALLRLRGKALFHGRAGCAACHKVGKLGKEIKGPNMGVGDGMTQPIAVRAASRIGNLSAMEYIVTSIVDPDGYIVKGYVRGVMKRVDEPPISLRETELIAIAAYLASIGAASPITDEDVRKAEARIQLARRFRDQRRADKQNRPNRTSSNPKPTAAKPTETAK